MPRHRRLPRPLTLCCALLLALAATPRAHAVGALADVTVRDRSTGETLPVYAAQGRWYVAGQPGHRYAIHIANRRGERLLAVMSVDGVNVLSGETAAWDQRGYVFNPWQGYEVSGWRKSTAQVAAFEFTALPDSYAARTGRPDDVGVIGVALFRERADEPPAQVLMRGQDAPRSDGTARERKALASSAARGESPAAPSPADATGGSAEPARASAPAMRLGTGHGPRESSPVRVVSFTRARSEPDEVITLWYDSRENLIAQGIIAPPRIAQPRPFPQSQPGYVPDPPRRW
jgi:hypothetical protein